MGSRPRAGMLLQGYLPVPLQWYWESVEKVFCAASPTVIAQQYARAQTIVRAYYAFLFVTSFTWNSRSVADYLKGRSVEAHLDLWLSSLIPHENWLLASVVSAVVLLLGSLLCALDPASRSLKITTISALLIFLAIRYDQGGKINHGLHIAIWAGIAFCFLPRATVDEPQKATDYLGVFFGAQLFVALLYSLAGFSKLLGAIYDYNEGITWFHLDALPLTIASNWNRSRETLLGGVLIQSPHLSQWLNWGAIYLECCSLLAIFNPRLHRIWGFGLVLMHTMIMHSMKIHFHQSAAILLLLFVASPFAPQRFQLLPALLSLPGLPLVRHLIKRRPASTNDTKVMSMMPHSRLLQWWVPVGIVIYLSVSLSRLDPKEGRFGVDIYPTTAMWMFWRTNNEVKDIRRLKRIRKQLTRSNREQKTTALKKKPMKRNKP